MPGGGRRTPGGERRAARDREIVAERAAGLPTAEIAARHGLTRQRVEQILDRSGGAANELARAHRAELTDARRAQQLRRARERSGEILARYRHGEHPRRIATALGLQQAAVKRAITELSSDADRAARARALAGIPNTRYAERELLDGLAALAARLGHTPSAAEYRREAGALGLATLATLHLRFGGWRQALGAAGLEGQAANRLYAPRWHVAACWRALESVADQLGDPPRYARYLQLAAARDDLPSGATVRQRLGLWSQIAAELSAHLAAAAAERADDRARRAA